MNYRITFYVFISLFFLSTGIFAQAQLVQSFIEQNNKGNTRFGFSVSTAGDVNNDGYDDVIIGAEEYDDFTGRAYVFFGGNPMDSIADVRMTGENPDDYFGRSVSTAGDVNNDGYDDVFIGADGYDDSKGRTYIYFGGSSMNNIADIVMTGENANDYFGRSVSTAGDINNDGFDDIIVGAHGYNDYTGKVYVYFGGTNMDDVADLTMIGEKSKSYFGFSVSNAGDVNSDEYDDLIVCAYRYNDNTGKAYVFFGGNPMDSIADVRMTGENPDDYFGRSVSTAGDVNNDGYYDVIVGAYGYLDVGGSFIYYGGVNMDNTADIIMTGGDSDYFGFSVSNTGDVNNDGFDDVIVGAWSSIDTGRSYIYYGDDNMDNTADVVLLGENSDYFGYSVSNAGDINNDGFDDVIVGAFNYNQSKGRADIYLGAEEMDNSADITMSGEGRNNTFGYSVSTAGDVNGDGFDDIVVGADRFNDYTGRAYIFLGGNPMDSIVDVIMTGEHINTQFGYSVSNAGDVNDDGFDDIIVGSKTDGVGCVYIYLGSKNMDNSVDRILKDETDNSHFGSVVSTAGDVNGDGFDDIIIGASKKKQAYIYLGGNEIDTIKDVTLSGFKTSLSTAGDVNNDGFDDVIVANSGYSTDTFNEIGRTYIYYGGITMDSIPDIIMIGDTTYSHFGYSVSNAGDVNNDGYDDVIVGTGVNSFHNTPGFAYIFCGGTTMDTTADVTMTVNPPSYYYGGSVSTAGDINNDGYSDVIVGDYLFDSYTGRAFIYYGSNEMDSIADIIITGEGTYNYFGYSVSNAGDVNNDGYDDVIIGAYQYSENGKAYIYSDPNAPLPVELTAFTAKIINNSVQLNWVTATELNNYGFEIERKKEITNKWQKIGFVEGHGNSNSVNKYSFIDNDIQNGEVQYRLKQIDNDGSFEYSKIFYIEMKLPTQFELEQNYPNPFNPVTTIKYSIPTLEMLHSTSPRGIVVQLKVYDVLGKEIETLVNEKQNPGNYKVDFNASKLSSGIYFYRLQAGKFVISKKMLLIK